MTELVIDGSPLSILTIVHVLISLVGIFSGFLVFYGMVTGKSLPGWTKVFLANTLATSVTGFFFPITKFTPALGFGILSIILLGLAYHALYGKKLSGGWRKTYVITALFAQYLNTFVLIVQLFLKVPALHALAPTQAEPPFGIAQGLLLIGFIGFGTLAVKRFRGVTRAAA